MKLTVAGQSFEVEVRGTTVTVDGVPFDVTIEGEGPIATVLVAGKRLKVQLRKGTEPPAMANVDGKLYEVFLEGALRTRPSHPFASAAGRPAAPAGAPGAVTAIMPGRVLSVRVKEGEQVQEGDVLLILEAMKMENEIHAPVGGTVRQVAVTPGANVNGGDVLVVIE